MNTRITKEKGIFKLRYRAEIDAIFPTDDPAVYDFFVSCCVKSFERNTAKFTTNQRYTFKKRNDHRWMTWYSNAVPEVNSKLTLHTRKAILLVEAAIVDGGSLLTSFICLPLFFAWMTQGIYNLFLFQPDNIYGGPFLILMLVTLCFALVAQFFIGRSKLIARQEKSLVKLTEAFERFSGKEISQSAAYKVSLHDAVSSRSEHFTSFETQYCTKSFWKMKSVLKSSDVNEITKLISEYFGENWSVYTEGFLLRWNGRNGIGIIFTPRSNGTEIDLRYKSSVPDPETSFWSAAIFAMLFLYFIKYVIIGGGGVSGATLDVTVLSLAMSMIFGMISGYSISFIRAKARQKKIKENAPLLIKRLDSL